MKRIMWITIALAGVAALAYILMGLGVLSTGLAPDEAPAGIAYAAAGGYLLGGALILLRRRWLWVIGAAINGLIVVMFISMYAGRTAVLFSAGGLISKAAQILLEVGLIYLIVAGRRRSRAAAPATRLKGA